MFQVTFWGTIQSLMSFGRRGWRWNTRLQGRPSTGKQPRCLWGVGLASLPLVHGHGPQLTTGYMLGLHPTLLLRPGETGPRGDSP